MEAVIFKGSPDPSMFIVSDSELMKNQKYASVMDPARQFDVMQNQDGTSLFFSIGADEVLYATQETSASQTGWIKYDISSGLAGRFGEKTIAAKQFAVTQSPKSTSSVDLALVTHVNGNDSLFLALDVPTTPGTLANMPFWVYASFDAQGRAPPLPFTIADVYLMNIPGTGVLCFADVIRNPADNTQVVDRYYIDVNSSPTWTFHPLPDDISAGSVVSCLGKRPEDPVGGIYTFGFIGSKQDLIYTPVATKENPFPESIHLALPPFTTTIASMLDSSGNTFLFVAWPLVAAIYVFTPDQQYNGACAQAAADTQFLRNTGILYGTQTLTATNVSELWSLSCPSGSETNPDAWSNPVPLCYDVFQFAHYLNAYQGAANSVLFAQTYESQLMQLTQDPITSIWAERSVLLPADNVDSVIEFCSYTSHIKVVDANGMGVPTYPVSLSSSSPISVNVNDIYLILRPDETIQIFTNSSGTITIIEETQTLSGTTINVTVNVNGQNIVEIIDPLENACQRLKPLVPISSVRLDQLDFAANEFKTLLDIKPQLLVNGTAKAKPALMADGPAKGGPSSRGIGSWFKLLWGDMVRWFKKAWNTVKTAYSQIIDGVWHFIVEVGDDIYSAVIDSVAAVIGAAEYVFKQIAVAYDDIVKYLGFLFNWDDIKRTHFVVKNILKLSAQQVSNSITEIEDGIKSSFATIEEKVDQWSGLPDPGQTIGQQEASQSSVPSRNSPQANWALHHATSNLRSAQSEHDLNVPVTKQLEAAFTDLFKMMTTEEGDIIAMVKSLVDVVKDFASLSAKQLFEKIAAIITDFVLNTVENCVLTLLDLVKLFTDAFLAALDAPLDIPILSPIYKNITGDQLSYLDLVCFIGAIPATVIYKAITNNVPFPANDLTNQLITAPDYTALRNIFDTSQPTQEQQIAYAKYMAIAGKGKLPAVDKGEVFDICTVVSDGMALFCSIFVWECSVTKTMAGEIPSKTLRGISMVSYLGYVMPDLIGGLQTSRTWYNGLNWGITGISIGKVAVDNIATNEVYQGIVGPLVECAINVAWVVPAVGDFIENNRTTSSKEAFAANILFDVGGMLAPGASKDICGPEVVPAVLVAQLALTLGYAACCLVSGNAVLNGD
ncbi:uncharacterized protein N7477_008812 [Penicillium maclennaniae]|uniref:uncharacterized protein n=1 Tax=Penicillium maclennaniae TaxID=1343394 RepID=UPI0025419C7C|nr:uncharacterized protein N7477_008812 [Penicillium maclennaniae]KAJ5666364.1 hypothetical protein N7477_008812 [Penicillium maclennaniae]